MNPEPETPLAGVVSNREVCVKLERNARSKATRSRQMVNVLRQQFLYSEKRARDIIIREIEGILRQPGSPCTVSKLARETAASAPRRARQAGYALSNWDTPTKATINAMLGAGVLIGEDGHPIPPTIAAPATKVVSLAGQFQDRLEAYLLEVVLRKLGDVTARDHKALAHALFRQFDPSVPIDDLEDRVAILLASLSGRVELAEGGTYFPI